MTFAMDAICKAVEERIASVCLCNGETQNSKRIEVKNK